MVSVRIPKNMNQKLTEYVKHIGITKNAFILSLIKQKIEKHQGKGNLGHYSEVSKKR